MYYRFATIVQCLDYLIDVFKIDFFNEYEDIFKTCNKQ